MIEGGPDGEDLWMVGQLSTTPNRVVGAHQGHGQPGEGATGSWLAGPAPDWGGGPIWGGAGQGRGCRRLASQPHPLLGGQSRVWLAGGRGRLKLAGLPHPQIGLVRWLQLES